MDSRDPGSDPAVGRPDLHHRDDPGLQRCGRVRERLRQRYGEGVRLDRDDDVALLARHQVGPRGRQQAQRIVRHSEFHSTPLRPHGDSAVTFRDIQAWRTSPPQRRSTNAQVSYDEYGSPPGVADSVRITLAVRKECHSEGRQPVMDVELAWLRTWLEV